MTCNVLHTEHIKVTVLCKEASPPSAAHVRAYLTAVHGEPSITQPPPSEGEEELHSPASNPHLQERTPQHLQADLGDLVGEDLYKLREDLCWKVMLHELNIPPEVLHQHHGGIQQVIGVLIRMIRRSPFQKGEGGFLQSNHFYLLPLHNQMKDGLLRDHLLNPGLLLSLIQTWGT